MISDEKRDRQEPSNGGFLRDGACGRDDRIAAYLDGEMTHQQMTDFESQMQEDTSLRRQVERWREALAAARDWMNAEAPGVKRVTELRIPEVARRPQTQARHARATWRSATRPWRRSWPRRTR